MTFPVTTFDNQMFNEGEGAAEVVAIHLAIKERLDAIALSIHPHYEERYETKWTTSPIWTHEPQNDGRTYLRDVLLQFYDDLIYAVAYFTEESAGDVSWTEESLVADIGMGDFSEFLIEDVDDRAFKWLHEALNRLIYGIRTINGAMPGNYTRRFSNTYGSAAAAWANRNDNSSADAGTLIERYARPTFGGYKATVRDNIGGLSFNSAIYSGEIVRGAYRFNVFNLGVSAPSLTIRLGGTDFISPATMATDEVWVEWPGIEFSTDANPSLLFKFVSPEEGALVEPGDHFASVTGARIYLDLTSILTDQQPEEA